MDPYNLPKAQRELYWKIDDCFNKWIVHRQEILKAIGETEPRRAVEAMILECAREKNYIVQADGWFARYVGPIPEDRR